MGLKQRVRRLFRGPTSKGFFQTVDVGTWHGEWLGNRAKTYKKRRYVAVDSAYKDMYNPEVRGVVDGLKGKGVVVRSRGISKMIDEMLERGFRTRHINIDMPVENVAMYSFRKLFAKAHEVLLPNGKIYISSPTKEFLVKLEELAQANGLSTQWRKPFTKESARTESMQNMMKMDEKLKAEIGFEDEIYRLEITYGLKKAVPDKNERRKVSGRKPIQN